jgi:branched-chain amino acid transport system substrate-binding protein
MALGMVAGFAAGAMAAEPGITDKEIVLGGTNALTGPIASACSLVSDGATAYLEAVNAKGGVNGRVIKYQLLDDNYSAQRAIANVRRLVDQVGVFALFGGCGTATAAAALSAVEKTEVPYLFPFAGMEALVDPVKKNVFALLPLYSTQLETMLPFVLQRQKIATAAIYSDNVPGNAEWRAASRKALDAAGVKVVADEMIDVTSPERAPFVLTAKNANPDLLVLVDSAPGAARFFIEMQRQGWKPKAVLGPAQMSDSSFLRAAAGADTANLTVVGVTLPVTDPAMKECNDALAAYRKDVPPSSLTAYGCLTAKVMVEALRRAGKDLTRAKLVAVLENGQPIDTGISGPVSFTATRHMGLTSFYPLAVDGSTFKVLGPPLNAK